MTANQVLKKNYPSYFFCQYKDVERLTERAKKESKKILKEFSLFFNTHGHLSIEITPKEHIMGYSISAALKWDDNIIMQDDDCELVFLQLNQLMLKQMVKQKMPSAMKGE